MPSPLTEFDDAALCAAYRAGSREAGDAIVRHYEALATYFGRRYFGVGVDSPEACQIARLAILHAATKYDSARGTFPTYARYWVRGMLRRARQESRVVAVPVYLLDKRAKWEEAQTEGWALKAVPLEDAYDDETASHERFLADTPTPEEALIQAEEEQAATDALSKLGKRERRIIRDHVMRQTKTLEEIGAVFGVTRERIRQVESIALRRLRKEMDRAA